jgi:putative transposase
MKKTRFTEEQIVRILKESETGGQTIGELCRKHGVTEQTFYRWRQKYGGLSIPELRKLREYEKENARLKRLVAERDLEIDAMKALLEKKW